MIIAENYEHLALLNKITENISCAEIMCSDCALHYLTGSNSTCIAADIQVLYNKHKSDATIEKLLLTYKVVI